MAETKARAFGIISFQTLLRGASSTRRGGDHLTVELPLDVVPATDLCGFTCWQHRGLETIRSDRSHWRIDRKVDLTSPGAFSFRARRPWRWKGRCGTGQQ